MKRVKGFNEEGLETQLFQGLHAPFPLVRPFAKKIAKTPVFSRLTENFKSWKYCDDEALIGR